MGPKLYGFLLLCACVSISSSRSVGDVFQFAAQVVRQYLFTGRSPSNVENAVEQSPLTNLLKSDPEVRELDDTQVCFLCRLLADVLIYERNLGMTNEQITAEATYVCALLNIETYRVCEGVIKPNVAIFTYLVDNTENISGSRICALLLPNKSCDNSIYEWTIDIPEGNTTEKVEPNGTNTFNVLHISDIHYDPRYTPGKSSQCGEPLCCQDDQADGTNASDTCGYWSEYYKADTPLHTIQESFKRMATHEFDYVYYTGDTVRHRVWSTSVEDNTKEITTITDEFRNYFNVPVFAALGNHEPHPVNAWSSEGIDDDALSTQWLFKLVAEEWGEWLTDDAKETILKGGYYTLSPKSGFRVVVLNNNVCYNENWWLINDNKDPYGQLAWLVEVLLAAEENKESVHLLMHMPTGTGSCLNSWSREYAKIIKRFSNTITGQFTGHSHKDQFWINYDIDDSSTAVGVVWNGASINTDKSNPSYKLYQIDQETFDVIDFEEWTFNLTQANLDPTKDLEWYKLYSFKDSFGLDTLGANELDSLLTRMAKDPTLIQKYYNYKFRNSDAANEESCNISCQKTLLCDIVSTSFGDNGRCDELKQIYDDNN